MNKIKFKFVFEVPKNCLKNKVKCGFCKQNRVMYIVYSVVYSIPSCSLITKKDFFHEKA